MQLPPQHCSIAQLRDAVRRAEDLGADLVFTWDHFFPLYGDPQGRHYEAWTMLGAWAEQTTTIGIGVLVSSTSFRNPDLVADMARTVDEISGGRLTLGLGAGWNERDHLDYGYPMPNVRQRLDGFAESLARIRSRLTRLNPPARADLPILIGGAGERRTLRLVAEHASIWHSFTGGAELAHKLSVLRTHCRDLGRDPDDIEISCGVGGLGREGRLPQAPEVEGAPLLAQGATLFTMNAQAPGFDLGHVPAWLRWRDQINAG